MPTAAAVVSTESFVVAPIAPCRTPSIDMGLDLGLGSSVSSSGSVDSPLPFIGRFSFDLNDTELKYAVFCFVKNYVGAAGGNSVAIDNRIVQALDIVKDRLIHAVREEVDELKLKIEELNLRIRELESENSLLRGAVPTELLAQIDSQKAGAGQN